MCRQESSQAAALTAVHEQPDMTASAHRIVQQHSSIVCMVHYTHYIYYIDYITCFLVPGLS